MERYSIQQTLGLRFGYSLLSKRCGLLPYDNRAGIFTRMANRAIKRVAKNIATKRTVAIPASKEAAQRVQEKIPS